MTVKQLIEKLGEYDPEMPVMSNGYEGGLNDIDSFEKTVNFSMLDANRFIHNSVPIEFYKNKIKNKIVIIGHSNGRDNPSEKATIDFTKGRATTIKKYLVDRGIDGKRIEIDGRGDHEMLFELPRATAEQQEQNRRVEIMVLEF